MTKYENEVLERLACDVANAWLRQQLDPRAISRLEPHFMRKLDELQGLTRGDNRRCLCLSGRDSGGESHDVLCPAYRESAGKRMATPSER